MTEALPRPGREILDGLYSFRAIQSPRTVLAPDHAEDFDINDVWGSMIDIAA
jgi:hypothetical protein